MKDQTRICLEMRCHLFLAIMTPWTNKLPEKGSEQSDASNYCVTIYKMQKHCLKFFSDNPPLLVKQFVCIICNELFLVENEFLEHCFYLCCFPVDFVELFQD